jgi:hypothetical protein
MVTILRIVLLAAACLPGPLSLAAQATSPSAADPRTACAADIQRLCPNVASGGGRILACLKQQSNQVSNGCKQAVLAATGRSAGAANPAVSAAPAPAIPAPAAPPAPAEPDNNPPPAPPSKAGSTTSRASSSGSASSGPRYYVMKKVQIIDQGLGKGKPAYDLMIPKDWQFKSAVNFGGSDSGCFDDLFAVFGDAKSPDEQTEMTILPQQTWQYMDDPNGQRQMQAQNQSDAKVGLKPCPVRAPVRAETFLRQDMMKKFPAGSVTVVSVEPFPALAEMTRHQLGLPPAAGASDNGDTRVEAARMRVTFDHQGQPSEGWVTAAIVVHLMPGGGRGAAYDWHAVNVMTFGTPKGKLDANDKLFKLILSTIHPELDWQKMSNGYISQLYQFKAKQVAIQQQAITEFRQHAANVINGVTARMVAGGNQSQFGQDQLIREVQTFRDPSTGATYELSNHYDHAWLDHGKNEYVMSDDPNFNPNGNLDGSWNQLQLVRPAP